MSAPDQAMVALHRFGVGAGPVDRARVGSQGRAYVLDQIGAATSLPAPNLPAGEVAIRMARLSEFERQDQRKKLAEQQAGMEGAADAASPRALPPPYEALTYRDEAAARFAAFASSDTPLVERLAMFWSNHFAVAINKAPMLRASAGAFEREAIRPYIFGKFGDMLRAVAQHPAMLVYLDNFQSVGPNSRAGQRSKRGLNENLAREIMELHTLGVDGGYSQSDVTSFAKVLTGWTMAPPGDDDFYGGRFTFSSFRHEPGAQAILGKSYDQPGVEQGVAVLDDLAHHPATARHVARKLARHFISDAPPESLVRTLQDVFLSTRGDLRALTRALVSSSEAWSAPLAKLRSPQLFLAALTRAAQRRPETPALLGQLNTMGQPLWQPPGPNGFPDGEDAWGSSEGMVVRLDVASQWARLNGAIDPLLALDRAFGSAASRDTREAVARAESRAQALAILFMSPEFQRC